VCRGPKPEVRCPSCDTPLGLNFEHAVFLFVAGILG